MININLNGLFSAPGAIRSRRAAIQNVAAAIPKANFPAWLYFHINNPPGPGPFPLDRIKVVHSHNARHRDRRRLFLATIDHP